MVVRKMSGYTIVELMITVAIVGILSSWAVPQYFEFVKESRRADAISSMTRMLAQQELFFANNNSTYTNFVASLGYDEIGGANDLAPSQDGYYSLRLAACAGGLNTCIQVTATPIAGESQADDSECQSFVATSQGRQSATKSGGAANNEECWN